jgi:hypothetical protein
VAGPTGSLDRAAQEAGSSSEALREGFVRRIPAWAGSDSISHGKTGGKHV